MRGTTSFCPNTSCTSTAAPSVSMSTSDTSTTWFSAAASRRCFSSFGGSGFFSPGRTIGRISEIASAIAAFSPYLASRNMPYIVGGFAGMRAAPMFLLLTPILVMALIVGANAQLGTVVDVVFDSKGRVTDTGSRNGTRLDGVRVVPGGLVTSGEPEHPGRVVRLGPEALA